MLDDLMNTMEAAAFLGVSERRIRQLTQDGVLVARKAGRDWLIPKGELARYKRERPDANQGKRGRPFKT